MVKPKRTPEAPKWFKNLCPPMRNVTFAGALADEQEHQRRLAENRRHLGAEHLEKMAAAIGHKLNADQSVAVATDVFFDEDMTRCPVGVKVQLLGAGGVASYGVYNGRDPFWIGWAPVPKRRPR